MVFAIPTGMTRRNRGGAERSIRTPRAPISMLQAKRVDLLSEGKVVPFAHLDSLELGHYR